MTVDADQVDAVTAFLRFNATLTAVEFRDEDGKLVARPLAATRTLAKGRGDGRISVTIPAADCLGVLRAAGGK